jgi:hypothetical protein
MRSISRVGLVIGVALLLVADVSAQQRQRGQGRGGRGGFGGGGLGMLIQNEGVQKELKLSSSQVEQATAAIQKVRDKHQDELASVRDLQGDERREKMASLNKTISGEQEKALAGILTPDQVKRLKQIELQVRGAQAFSDAEVESHLKLTAEQKEKIKTIASDAQAERRELFQGGGAGGDRAEMQKKMTALNKTTMEKISAVLTPAQRDTWKEMTGAPVEVQFQGRGRRGGNQ